MKIDYQNAKKVCGDSEFELIRSSRPSALKNLTGMEIRKQSKIARKLHQLWKEQSIKQGNSSSEFAARTHLKRDLFAEAVARFERKLAHLEAERGHERNHERTDDRPGAEASPAAGKVERPDLAEQAAQRARIAAHRTAQSGVDTRIKGHVSGQGRRRQAVREARAETAKSG